MGFGLLFIGYILAFAFSVAKVYMFFDVIGSLIMTYALIKLQPHEKRFGVASAFSFTLALLGVAMFALTLAAPELTVLITVLEYIKIACVLSFHVFLLSAVRGIAAYTELPKLAAAAVRNLIIGCVYIAANTILSFFSEPAVYLALPLMLFGYVWIILNAVLIYSCYMRICLEGDEDMEPTPSRFAVINKVSDKLNAIEDKVFIKKKAPEEEPPAERKGKKKKR